MASVISGRTYHTDVCSSVHVSDQFTWIHYCVSPQFTGLSVTSGVDQMVALHTISQDDVLLCLQRGELCPNQDRVGELVGALVDHFTRSVPQQHTDSSYWGFCLHRCV